MNIIAYLLPMWFAVERRRLLSVCLTMIDGCGYRIPQLRVQSVQLHRHNPTAPTFSHPSGVHASSDRHTALLTKQHVAVDTWPPREFLRRAVVDKPTLLDDDNAI